ncbi:MAG: hypothetical protein WC294_00265 [Methanoregula sp.]|jgi:sulfite reductase alpha subunit-like flavoprotein
MTAETLEEAKILRGKVQATTKHLEMAKAKITVTYYNGDYHSILPINPEIKEIIQAIVVSSFEKELKEHQAAFAAL